MPEPPLLLFDWQKVFKVSIKFIRTDNSVVADAKSILSVLTLAASKGVELKLEVEGEDEKRHSKQLLRNFC